MSLNNCNKKIVKQNDCVAKYRRRNEEYTPYLSKYTFKKRGKAAVKHETLKEGQRTIVRSNNHNFTITRQIKNSKPNRTIYKIGNQEFYF